MPVTLVSSRRAAVWLALLPCAALAVGGCDGGHAIAPPGDWARARQIPGTELMSSQYTGDDGKALVNIGITSAAPSGWCTAVGDYSDRASGETRMFMVSER